MEDSDSTSLRVLLPILDLLCLSNIGQSLKICLTVTLVLHCGHSGIGSCGLFIRYPCVSNVWPMRSRDNTTLLERAIRTNDLQLYIYTLTPIIDLFFAMNHLNYARWLSKFQLDLMNVDDSHPGLNAILENGSFSIRRTDKQFSRIPIDLTLEQTVNADASSHLSTMTNNYSARFRWMATNAIRASFVNLIEEMAGLVATKDGTVELQPSRIRHHN